MDFTRSRNYVGIDPSLRSTGIALISVSGNYIVNRSTELLKPPGQMRGTERLVFLRNAAQNFLKSAMGDSKFSTIEGPSLGSVNRADDLGSVRGVFKIVLADWGSLPTEIPPTSLKKFATRNGNAKKEAMIDAAKKDWGVLSEDEADAAWLAEFARALHDNVSLTRAQLEAIRGIKDMKIPKPRTIMVGRNIVNI